MPYFNGLTRSKVALELSCKPWKQTYLPVYCWTTIRQATHAAQGRANGPKNGPGKRLGAKKTGDEYVVPGNIIFRQRGTQWFPGENVGIGRDHTLFALQSGYVKYYQDPKLHPKRKYIGVVFDKRQSLPSSAYAPRRRRLGMIAVSRFDEPKGIQSLRKPRHSFEVHEEPDGKILSISKTVRQHPSSKRKIRGKGRRKGRGKGRMKRRENRREKATERIVIKSLQMRSDYSYRESNWEIGRAAERAGIRAPPFKKGNRFLAWRKRRRTGLKLYLLKKDTLKRDNKPKRKRRL